VTRPARGRGSGVALQSSFLQVRHLGFRPKRQMLDDYQNRTGAPYDCTGPSMSLSMRTSHACERATARQERGDRPPLRTQSGSLCPGQAIHQATPQAHRIRPPILAPNPGPAC
jgi:hypothetical protein